MANYQLQIFTQEEKVFDKQVTALTVPGAGGYFGVWAHHAPIVTTISKGKLTIRIHNEETECELEGGFFEMHNNIATLLVDSFRA